MALFLRLFFTVCLLYSFAVGTWAQQYNFRHYQVENGLSNNAAICTIQDKQGFMWFGTKDGLNRFDGYSFKIYRHDPAGNKSIGSNFIHCLHEDAKGILWVGTEKGIYRYDAATESFSPLSSFTNGAIADIKTDAAGNLWFIMNLVLQRYEPNTKILTTFSVEHHGEFTSVSAAKGGDVWFGTPSGFLKKYDPTNKQFILYDVFSKSGNVASKWIEKVHVLVNGNVLIGTSNQGCKMFDVRTKTYTDILTYNEDRTALFVRNFLEAGNNEIWIATESGIFIYNSLSGKVTNLQKAYNNAFSISDNAVYCFCKDKEGGIWAGTYFGGINYYPKQNTAFKKIFPKTGENSLSGNVVREILDDAYGNRWIGTEDAGLNKYNKQTGLYTAFLPADKPGSIAYTNIHGLLVDSNKLWIGTFEHGLDVMNIKTGLVEKHFSKGSANGFMRSNFIHCLAKTENNTILAGTTIGAYSYNRSKDNFDTISGLPVNNWYAFLLEDSHGIIWAATYGNGVRYTNLQTGKSGNFTATAAGKNSIPGDRVNSVFEDSEQNMWFTTEAGLSRWNRSDGSIKNFTTKDGLPTDYTLSILEDDRKNLWISTTKGLATWERSTGKIKQYTTVNGLLNDQFNFNSAYKDSSGNMYFGSVKGLISFNPAAFADNPFIPPVYITGFQVFNREPAIGAKGSPLKKSITYTTKLQLLYDESTVSIDFAALGFSAPEMAEYAYRMIGVDENWTYLKKNRKAYFTNLKPGHYRFIVKSSNGNGIWNLQQSELSVEILPPWWAGGPAYMVYFCLMIAFIYFFIRYYHQYTEAKNKRRYELLEIAKDKEIFHAKIEFFTHVAHEIKTPLTLIKAPLEKVMKKAANMPEFTTNLQIMDRNTNRLIDLTNQLLDFRQTEISGFSLSFVQADVGTMLADVFASFKPLADEKNIGYEMQLPGLPVQAFVDLDAFKKILYNLFSNAVKYAEQQVFVKLLPMQENAGSFTIHIKNDGYLIPASESHKIFEPFVRLKETETQKGTGIGLALARSLAQLHNGSLTLLPAENGLNCFELILPVHQQHEFHFR